MTDLEEGPDPNDLRRERERAYQREWARRNRAKNPEKYRARFTKWRLKNLAYVASARRQWVAKNPERALFLAIRGSAKRRGISFDLRPDDIKIPEFCPVLGIPLRRGGLKDRNSSPSVDRLDNSKGYTRDNIRIISYRANSLKRDATIDELEKIISYMRVLQ